jgi:hypothetical protein
MGPENGEAVRLEETGDGLGEVPVVVHYQYSFFFHRHS